MSVLPKNVPVIEIRCDRKWAPLSLTELWQFRFLFYALVWRDITIRYKQTLIGVLWAVIQPAFMMILFTVIFGRLMKFDTGGVAYPVFSYCALLSWIFFARGLGSASMSLVTNEAIITKVYFPRILVPTAAVMTAFVDFLIAFVVLIPLLVWYDVSIHPPHLLYPLFVLINVIAALGVAYIFSIIDALYRDVRLVLPFLTQLIFFATPVIYSSQIVPARYEAVFWINPMVGVIEGVRWSLLNYPQPPLRNMAYSCLGAVILFLFGILFFQKMERKIVDRI